MTLIESWEIIRIVIRMKSRNKIIIGAVLSFFSLGVINAQQGLQSSYFMEGSLFRHELNPAFASLQSYVSMPALGQIGAGARGNLGLSNLFYYRNGKTVTYLHPDVSTMEVLNGINDNNKVQLDVKTQIIGVGFRGLGGFNTIGLSARVFAGMHVPYDLFALTKDLQNKSYQIGGVGLLAQGYAELAIGHSHRIDEHWSVGGKFKLLIGAARASADLQELTLDLQGTNQWTASAHAVVETNIKGLSTTTAHKSYNDPDKNQLKNTATGETYGYETIDKFNMDKAGIGGLGMAVDLGAEYDFADIVPGLKVSLACLDLGFINWNVSRMIKNNGERFIFDGFHDIQVNGGPGRKASDQADELADRLVDLYRLQDQGDQGSRIHGIGATLNIGCEYALSVYDKLRFGFLSSTRLLGDYTWNEERLSVNYAPADFFDFNINGAVGSFGPSLGWMINLHPVGFNFFIGMDHTLGKVSKQFIPLSSNASFMMGINFPLNRVKKHSEEEPGEVDEYEQLLRNYSDGEDDENYF